MAHMNPLPRGEIPELEDLFAPYDTTLGFVPNSLFTMARRPEILRAFSELITQIWNTGSLPKPLKPLLAIVSSSAAGCRYCQAHEAVDASERGVGADKIAAIWYFETSPLFDDAERAALRLARDASVLPNGVGDRHFAELREHWDDGQIVEMMAVIGLFGFLNRWNDTMATDLEDDPMGFASATYADEDWDLGKHG